MILELKGIYKEYQQGKMKVPVLKDVNFSMEEGEVCSNYGTFRFRKDHTYEYYRLPGSNRQREPFTWTDRILKLVLKMQCRISDFIKIGFVFQSFHLLPKQSCTGKCGNALKLCQGSKEGTQRKGAEGCWKEWGLQIVWILSRTSCPEDRCRELLLQGQL